jgi:hypothetical protein
MGSYLPIMNELFLTRHEFCNSSWILRSPMHFSVGTFDNVASEIHAGFGIKRELVNEVVD